METGTGTCTDRNSPDFKATAFSALPGELLQIRKYQYPNKPYVILCASDAALELKSDGAVGGLVVYTENARISQDLKLDASFSLYATNLDVGPSSKGTISIDVSGHDGVDDLSEKKDAGGGHALQIFARNLITNPGVKLNLRSLGGRGGKGKNLALASQDAGETGGDGGEGGRVRNSYSFRDCNAVYETQANQ